MVAAGADMVGLRPEFKGTRSLHHESAIFVLTILLTQSNKMIQKPRLCLAKTTGKKNYSLPGLTILLLA